MYNTYNHNGIYLCIPKYIYIRVITLTIPGRNMLYTNDIEEVDCLISYSHSTIFLKKNNYNYPLIITYSRFNDFPISQEIVMGISL